MRCGKAARASASHTQGYSEEAFFELVERAFETHAFKIRTDIDDGFDNFVEQRWPDGVKDYRSSSLLNALYVGNPSDAKKRELLRKAIGLLARKANPGDRDRIRKALDERRIALTDDIIRYFAKLGEASDALLLMRAASKSSSRGLDDEESYDPNQFADTVLSLATDLEKVVQEKDVSATVVAQLVSRMSNSDIKGLGRSGRFVLLSHSNNKVRRTIALKCVVALTKREFGQTLLEMRERESYYYNAAFWLDLGVSLPREEAKVIAQRAL